MKQMLQDAKNAKAVVNRLTGQQKNTALATFGKPACRCINNPHMGDAADHHKQAQQQTQRVKINLL